MARAQKKAAAAPAPEKRTAAKTAAAKKATPESRAKPTGTSGTAGAGAGADNPSDVGETAAANDVTETIVETYEPIPGGGHRITRRKVRRTETDEDVTIREYFPPGAYSSPASPNHPVPVG